VFEDSVLRLEKDHNTRPRPEKDWFLLKNLKKKKKK